MVKFNISLISLLLASPLYADAQEALDIHSSRRAKAKKGKKGKKAKGKPAKSAATMEVEPAKSAATMPATSEVNLAKAAATSEEVLINPTVLGLLNNANGVDAIMQYMQTDYSIGSITALIPEATDVSSLANPASYLNDGMSADVDFPFGAIKTIATVGEYDKDSGTMIVGVPDGLGSMLADDDTVRVIVQSESYLPSFTSRPLQYGESYPFDVNVGFIVNEGRASFTGSHVQYVDYDREGLSTFMDNDDPASEIVTGFGNIIEHSYNLKDELVGPRNRDGATTVGAHYSNTDADGNWVVQGTPTHADWVMQSLCSASLSEKHMWGEGMGFEDDVFITNEEWMTLEEETLAYTGLSAHVIDIATKTDYAIAGFTNSGFEKIVEIHPMSSDFVIVSPSGYNGAFSNFENMTIARNEFYAPRADGEPWVKPQNTHPARVYIGKKGYMEDGSPAPADDFKARNGLRYGKVYGFAVDMAESGPSDGFWRDAFHKDAEKAFNGAEVDGFFMPVDWMWNGTVTDFIHDGAWDFQDAVPNAPEGYQYWNAKGNDEAGCKTEHNTPIHMEGVSGFIQTSTCGYFGEYLLTGLAEALEGLEGNELPAGIESKYIVYQGELDIRSQIDLGGKGQYADGKNATSNYSGDDLKKVDTFEDIDGFEAIFGADGKQYAIIQEDSGNRYGERQFITELHHNGPLSYYLIAISGGDLNSRMMAGVGIPAGTNDPVRYGRSGHEFSGINDLSGYFTVDENDEFVLKADDIGAKMIEEKAKVHINDKYIVLNLQAHNMFAGPFDFFNTDRGGQWLLYQPDVPAFE